MNRLIYNQIEIDTITSNKRLIGVDTPKDILDAEKFYVMINII